LEEVFMRVGEE
jgi:hypothetical protein